LGRVHADEHRPRKLDRKDPRDRGDAAEFRGVGAPVATHRVDVVGRGHRPVAVLLGVLADLRGEVHRTLPAQLLEQRIRRSLQPMLAIPDENVLEVAANRRHLASWCCRGSCPAILLAGWPAWAAPQRVLHNSPVSPKPSACLVASVRSNSRPATNGPRSTTGTRTERPSQRNVTSVPHGSVRLATPIVPLVSDPPQATAPPPPYHE